MDSTSRMALMTFGIVTSYHIKKIGFYLKWSGRVRSNWKNTRLTQNIRGANEDESGKKDNGDVVDELKRRLLPTLTATYEQGGCVTVWRMPTEISQSRLAGRYKPSNACTIIAVKLTEYIYREGIILRPTQISLPSKRNGVRSHPRFHPRNWPSKILAEFEKARPITRCSAQLLNAFINAIIEGNEIHEQQMAKRRPICSCCDRHAETFTIPQPAHSFVLNTDYQFSDEIIKRSDLTLPWRPIYDLYIEVAYKRNNKNLEKSNIRSAVLAVKELFPLSATKEILDEIRSFIDVWNDYAMAKFVSLFSAFVPLKMSNEEHDIYGAGLWYDEMWISEYCPGYIDWSSKHTIIFSKLLRTLNLSVRYNKVAVGDGTGMGSESSGAEWIVWMLGGVNESAHQCFERLIKCVESFLHPLHEGGHTPTLQSFLDAVVNEMVRRVRTERVRQKTRKKVPSKMRLTDEQIEWFVSILLPSVLYSVFSTTETSTSNVMRNLAFLAPQLVLPKCLDLIYPSLSTTTEPHRLKQSLECIVEICVSLVRDNGTNSYRTYNVCKQNWINGINKIKEDREYKSTPSSIINESEVRSDKCRVPLREHAIFLLEVLIEAIDINDFQKLSLSLQTLETIFQLVPIVDCSAAPEMEKYMDLSEEEKHLCKLTSRFPNIVQDFVNKIFKVITQLSSSAPSDGISYVDSICDNSEIILIGNEEAVISTSMQSAFHALFSNCSSNFVELIGDQTYKFISTSEFENVIAADAACSLMQESIYANPVRYFPMYVEFLLEKQKQCVTEEKKILKELDATTMWFTYLSEMIFSVPSNLLLKYQKECIQMHKCTMSMVCYNAYQGSCWSLKNLLTQLIEIYPISEEDRQRNLDLPLHLSLPIKKWGVKCLKDVVTIKWHIPTDAEVDFAEKLLNEFAYSEVRIASQTTLIKLTTKFPNSKCLLVDDVLEHLDPKRNISHEEMKNSTNIRVIAQEMLADSNANNRFCAKYQELSCLQAILTSENRFNEKHEKNQQRIDGFRNELTEICKNKGQLYHWRQVDSARTFLFTFHRILFTAEVAEVFLQMLVDVRARWRHVFDPHFKYACGLRPDNLCIVYDRARLPKDEQTWNETIFVSKPHWGAYQWPRKLMVSAPANAQTELQRSVSEFNDVEKLILEYMKDEQFLTFWHAILLKEKEDSDVFYNERPVIRRAQTKLAAVYCAGIIRGSRNWVFKNLQEIWVWLKPIILYQIEGLMSETVYYWDIALKFCLDVTDVRRFHWLIETIFEITLRPAPTTWHRCVRLGLIQYISSCSAWRTTELLNQVIQIANVMISQAWLAPEREQIANVLSFPAVYGFAMGDESNIPVKYRIPKLGEIMDIFDTHIKEMMKLKKIQIGKRDASAGVQSKLITVSSSPPFVTSLKNSLYIKGRFNNEIATNPNVIGRQLHIKTLLRFLNAYFLSCFVALSSPIISLFPLITHLADEETADNDETEVVRDADLAVGASDVLFQSWSGIYLCDELADEMLNSVEQTMNKSTSWKAWVSIMKFLHVFVFSNILVCEKQERPEIVRRMVYNAICHTQLEVRREAADCLTALIHCGFQSLTSCYIKELFELTNHKILSKRHGAVLALSAVIRAFPFTIPPLVFDMIPKYCQLGINSDSLTRNTITETLRSFLRTHHDKMIETGEKDVIQKLLVFIQNVISPSYYV
uniref:BLM10_mid domain-containing protein n=1 Tax=Loa loa TaxID=7209 RepID=A0A1I7VC43_LOALO